MTHSSREDRRDPHGDGSRRGEWIDDPNRDDDDADDDAPRGSVGRPAGILLPGRWDLPE